MSKTDENGWAEYRINLPPSVNAYISKIADFENRSIPLMLRQLVYEGLSCRYFDRKRASIIKDIVAGKVSQSADSGD